MITKSLTKFNRYFSVDAKRAVDSGARLRYNTRCYHLNMYRERRREQAARDRKRETMERSFPETLSALRRGRNLSQRKAAADLGISQALLSHYETGAREPGLQFVCRACDYYGVTADYLLCRSEHPGDLSVKNSRAFLEEARAVLERAEAALNSAEGERA